MSDDVQTTAPGCEYLVDDNRVVTASGNVIAVARCKLQACVVAIALHRIGIPTSDFPDWDGKLESRAS